MVGRTPWKYSVQKPRETLHGRNAHLYRMSMRGYVSIQLQLIRDHGLGNMEAICYEPWQGQFQWTVGVENIFRMNEKQESTINRDRRR